MNGVDYSVWNPAVDKFIAKKFGSDDLGGKVECKKDLAKTMGIKYDAKRPILAMITRLAEQKGIDLVVNIMKDILKDSDFVILGFGDEKYNKIFQDMPKKYKGKVGVSVKFDNALSHKIEAGADMFLMPSGYEPCGLGQLISMSYGTIPLVFKTGGLADTVIDGKTGFVFEKYRGSELGEAMERAIAAWQEPKKWKQMVKTAMRQDFSWKRSAREYLGLYRKLVASKG